MKRFLRLIFSPTKNFIRQTLVNIKYLVKHKSLKLGNNVSLINVEFDDYNYISSNSAIKDCSFGRFSYVGENTRIRNLRVGNFTSIGPDVKIGLGEHPTDRFSTHPAFYSTAAQVGKTFSNKITFEEYNDTTKIGHDVWIGANVIIKGGISIGNGSIIASGAVVMKDVPDYSIVGGVPAHFIRKRLPEDKIKYLKSLEWWNKDDKWLQDNFNIIFND